MEASQPKHLSVLFVNVGMGKSDEKSYRGFGRDLLCDLCALLQLLQTRGINYTVRKEAG